MQQIRIGLLQCDHVAPELLGIAGDYDTMFEALFAAHPRVEIVPFDAVNGQLPSRPTECDAWLATGSRHSVNDREPWILGLEHFIREAAVAQVPFIGICFGHQLLATAFGGKVSVSDRGWGAGVKQVDIVGDLAIAPADLTSFRIVNSHSEQIELLPPHTTVLGSNEHCPISMMSVGTSMLGIQGHPEMSVDYSRALTEARRGTRIPEDTADAAIASLVETPDASLVADMIIEFVKQKAAGAPKMPIEPFKQSRGHQ